MGLDDRLRDAQQGGAPMLFFSSRAASLFLVLPRSMSFRAWLKREAAPSTVFRKMLPVNPSVTSTSAAPWLMASRPSMLPTKRMRPASWAWVSRAWAAFWMPLLGSEPMFSRPTRGFSMPRNRRA